VCIGGMRYGGGILVGIRERGNNVESVGKGGNRILKWM